MAVQPARIAPGDLRHVPGPRIRQTRTSRTVAARQPAARSQAAGVFRAPVQATRHVVATAPAAPWAAVDLRVRSRLRPAAVVLGVIIVATMLGLVYLTQTLAAASARYSVDRLLVDRETLMRTLTSQEGRIVLWGSEAQVVQWAQREGLDRLGGTVRVRAR
jgi:hypothetical protein